jgi:AcrR family transcriptional regulator
MNRARARSEKQKEKRVHEIVDATARLYFKTDYEDITFASIAKEANFTRSNLYKYFRNKEEIFLEFIKYDLSEWRKDICFKLKKKKLTSRGFASLWVETILGHERLIELFTILFSSIEKKSSLENLISFKKKIFEETELLIENLLAMFPDRAPGDVLDFIYAQFSLSIGIYPMLNMSENQMEAIKRAGSAIDQAYYRKVFVNAMESLVEKMLYQRAGG